jgi:hypothetical protein
MFNPGSIAVLVGVVSHVDASLRGLEHMILAFVSMPLGPCCILQRLSDDSVLGISNWQRLSACTYVDGVEQGVSCFKTDVAK